MEEGKSSFTWDSEKELANIVKHGVDFVTASKVFKDSKRKIYIDSKHSKEEERFFCIGKVGNKILTVRFTYRSGKIRIIGAGYWRKGEQYYEKKDDKSR
ncbi:MAG: BrnT family toxin [Candidatus Omnitrophota bacterium]